MIWQLFVIVVWPKIRLRDLQPLWNFSRTCGDFSTASRYGHVPFRCWRRWIAWSKRNPWPVAAAGLGVVAMLVLIVGQLDYQNRLADQRDHAVQNYQSARAAIWGMLDAADHESDLQIPRLQQLQVTQTEQALQLFESLANEEGTEEAFVDLGRIQMRQGSGLVAQGKFDQGKQLLERSQQTFQKLVEVSPDNLELLANFVSTQVKLGHTLTQSGKVEEAISIICAAIPLAERIRQRAPDNPVRANLAAWTHHNLGSAYVTANKPDLAVKEYQSAVKIRQSACSIAPENDELLRFLAESQVSLGVCEMTLGLPNVGETYLAAIETFEKIRQRNPDDPHAPVSAAVAYLNYSNHLASADDVDGAIDACTQGIKLIQPVIRANPDHYDAKSYLSMLFGNRAMFESYDNQPENAVQDWNSAIECSVDSAIGDQCRHGLVRDLLSLSQIDQAVAAMEQFQAGEDGQAAQFQLAAAWGAICNSM